MLLDTIFIKQLKVITTIGAYDWEQDIKQQLLLNLEMAHDNHTAGKSDDLNDALDYATISDTITSYVQNKHFYLIEKVAEDVANLLLTQFMIKWVKITVEKPSAVANAQTVGVTIIRQAA